jgi:predicted lipoprotein with Yx(FWY)xxD motif
MEILKKNWFLVLVLVVVVLVLGYLGRHRIKAMLGMTATPAPATQTITDTSSPTSAMAPSDNIYTTKTDSTKGSYLADFNGMTLYTYDKDTTGVSNCSVGCLAAWPAYSSGAAAQGSFPANINVITRSDESTQFAWKGMPLYYYAKDKVAGDVTGDGVGGVWHLVKP